jgi:CheY-like chemotaxis protein
MKKEINKKKVLTMDCSKSKLIRKWFFKAGCNEYITKPVDEDVLLMSIEKLLRK